MLTQKVKLIKVGEIMPYPKRENGEIVYDPQTGQAVIGGYRRQIVFESLDLRKDSIPFTLFNDEANAFSLATGTEGDLFFSCDGREVGSGNDTYCFAELHIVNFVPSC